MHLHVDGKGFRCLSMKQYNDRLGELELCRWDYNTVAVGSDDGGNIAGVWTALLFAIMAVSRQVAEESGTKLGEPTTPGVEDFFAAVERARLCVESDLGGRSDGLKQVRVADHLDVTLCMMRLVQHVVGGIVIFVFYTKPWQSCTLLLHV